MRNLAEWHQEVGADSFVHVYNRTGADLKITFSPGVSPARLRSKRSVIPYQKSALIPNEPFVDDLASVEILRASSAIASWCWHKDVAIVRMSEKFMEHRRTLGVARARSRRDLEVSLEAAPEGIVGFEKQALALALETVNVGTEYRLLGFSHVPHGLRTTTVDAATGLRTGLHVDGWYGGELRGGGMCQHV